MVKAQFLTPEFTSETLECRVLKIPDNKEWLGIFNSALLELLNQYNWEQVESGDLTIEQAISICTGILNDFWLPADCSDPTACVLPGGTRLLRLNAEGHYEEYADGEWREPTGDYAVPPVGERSETTADERKCAAAANAANVLKQTYEIVTDMVAVHASNAEIIAAFVAGMVAYLGSWIALPLVALIEIGIAFFIAFVEIAEFMTADLWDAEFDTLLTCVLYECATDSGDVVTFDFTCVNEKMASTVDLLSTDALNQLRLFGQVSFMLSVIGIDGLNIAGTTTEVEGDCSDCDAEWCICFDFTGGAGMHGWEMPYGMQDADGLRDNTTGFDGLYLQSPTFSEPTFVHQIEIWMNDEWTGISPKITVANDQTFTPPYLAEGTGALPAHFYIVIDAEIDTFGMVMDRYVGAVQRWDSLRVQSICVMGTGSNPLGEDNCEF